MVEAIDTVAVEVESADQSAEICRALVDGYVGARLKQAIRRGQAEDPTPHDADATRVHQEPESFANRARVISRQ